MRESLEKRVSITIKGPGKGVAREKGVMRVVRKFNRISHKLREEIVRVS